VAVSYRGTTPVKLVSLPVSSGDLLQAGDTLALATDTMALLEMERIAMEIDRLRFEQQLGDSSAGRRLDSLLSIMQTGLPPSPVLISFPGEVTNVLVSEGDRVQPGDTLARVSPTSATLVSVQPPPGVSIDRWPPELMNGSLLEVTDGAAVYSGLALEGSHRLPGSWMVPRRALWEDGLDTFLLVGQDTVPAARLGSMDGSTLIVSDLSGDELLTTWGPAETEGTEH
jgi:hypothetical protein